ncbi:PREDICTED: multiple epidermal growth factor-like domains protein 8 [Priapulus caudatus]|uniref:Multiple epidermal growth factor-like domains protein 8 n=1 Tax=Priapulus caudatus TaxID=37621 RepID=A0ABM1DR94_PRICU|nr:PREDICTED: multiple epidermal growth factor-like domains protein 8 [Priapulus caudatus]
MGRFRSPAALLLLQLLLLLLLHLGGLEASCTAGSSRRFITITFLQLDTECSYDYVFIYDGNNYSAPTLATLSGPTVPPPLTATSGYMLVHLYSDTNYARAGFNASYEIHDCPADCNEHGSCSATLGRCSCYPGWKGDSCHVEICPEGCGEARGRGTCSAEAQRCVCEDGYAGDSCSLHTLGQQGDNAWQNVSCDGCGLAPRAAHAAAYLPDTGALWLFGGYTLNAILGDLVAYNFSEGRWVAVTTTAGSAAPSARYGHAMAAYDGALWMYGGATADGSYSDELWTYDPAGSRWRRRGAGGDTGLPGLAGHSLTLVRDRWLYLYGGIGDDELSSAMFRVDVRRAGATWERVVHRNGKGAPHRVVGHSAVFHAETASLLVYGGFAHREHRAWFGRRVAALWAYHVDENVWLQLETGDSGAPYLHPAAMPPAPRAYHSANIIGNYMVVYGGNAYLADSGDLCHDRSMHFYHLGCQTWVDFPNLAKAFAKLTDTAGYEQRAASARRSQKRRTHDSTFVIVRIQAALATRRPNVRAKNDKN